MPTSMFDNLSVHVFRIEKAEVMPHFVDQDDSTGTGRIVRVGILRRQKRGKDNEGG